MICLSWTDCSSSIISLRDSIDDFDHIYSLYLLIFMFNLMILSLGVYSGDLGSISLCDSTY